MWAKNKNKVCLRLQERLRYRISHILNIMKNVRLQERNRYQIKKTDSCGRAKTQPPPLHFQHWYFTCNDSKPSLSDIFTMILWINGLIKRYFFFYKYSVKHARIIRFFQPPFLVFNPPVQMIPCFFDSLWRDDFAFSQEPNSLQFNSDSLLSPNYRVANYFRPMGIYKIIFYSPYPLIIFKIVLLKKYFFSGKSYFELDLPLLDAGVFTVYR